MTFFCLAPFARLNVIAFHETWEADKRTTSERVIGLDFVSSCGKSLGTQPSIERLKSKENKHSCSCVVSFDNFFFQFTPERQLGDGLYVRTYVRTYVDFFRPT